MSKFVHLHVHSHYSLLDGLTRIPELVAEVKADGQPAVALTDHGALYGAIEFYQTATKAGVQPIIGIEAYVAPRSRHEREKQVGEKAYSHLILLAKNRVGYQNLLQLTTKAHLEGYYYKPRIDWELLDAHGDGLIVLSGCMGGEIPMALREGRDEDAVALLRRYRDRFGEDFYLEMQRRNNIPELVTMNAKLLALQKKHKVPIVATNDVHYLASDDAEAQDILLCLQTKSKQSDTDRMTMRGENYSLRSAREMALLFEDLPEAIERTVEIAGKCNLQLELGKILLPRYDLPKGDTYETYLRRICEAGLTKRYATAANRARARERMDYELSVVGKMGLSSYFCIVQDFVNWAKQRGIVVGPGRGSAAGSIVSYLTNITNLDPLAYGLLFERFLAPGRIQMPDIDLDFADHRRDEVLAYVREKYGEDRVAQIITFGTMAARASIRDVGRVLDIPLHFCDRLAKLIPMQDSLDEAIAEVPELQQLIAADETTERLFDIAKRLEGVARHTSTHACGVVIAGQPLVEHTPTQRASADDATIVTQYEMHAIEMLGLLKMDFLGLSNLSIIEHAVNMIRARGVVMDVDKLPLDDAQAYALLQRGDSTGVFQLECLSGDTIVSNTTLRTLYERQQNGKPISGLRSVYVDSGFLHNNRVIAVKKSGAKQLYRLVTVDGRMIKASAEHRFMTEHGWKKLGDLVPGMDTIMYKPEAKYVALHSCAGCGARREVSSENLGKHHGFCYTCSAKHFCNPSKPESRRHISESRFAFYASGGRPWNEGLTAETSEVLRANGAKIARALRRRTLEDLLGSERAAVARQKLSERSRGERNPMFGKPSPHRKGGFRPDLGHYVRSNWEADFARIFRLHGIAYEYEPKRFTLRRANGELLSYTPDFFTPHDQTFYEIKGWMHDLDAEKIDLFRAQYSQYRFVPISATKFAEFAMQYRELVAWECPMVPDQLAFTGIREVTPLGAEETYDIVMAPPGNNFIANSFVVHNSGGMKRYLKDLKPSVFEDIIAMVALYRPGPMELIPEYIDRKFGRKPVEYLHPKLEAVLGNTYGIMVYQEQLMSLARELAGFTMSQADTLRKAVGKKIKSLLDEQREKLIDGMIAHEIPEKTARKIWEWIEPFARYGFNRSHAACYALIAYQTAYLKAHYPAEFMAALLTAERGNTDRLTILIQECREMGIVVLGPDVNESAALFTVVANTERLTVRFGLSAIKNVGEHLVGALIAERDRGGLFCDLADLCARVQDKDFNKKSLECMIQSGCLDMFAERGLLLANMDALLEYGRTIARDRAAGQVNLFGGIGSRPELRLQPAEPALQRLCLTWEKELLGLYLTAHPFTASARVIGAAATPITEVKRLPPHAADGRSGGARAVTFGGTITRVKRITTKKGDPMLFAEVEDSTGAIEVVVFPRVFTATQQAWIVDTLVLVRGNVSEKEGTPHVLADYAVRVVLGQEHDAVRAIGGVAAGAARLPEMRIVLSLPATATQPQLAELRALLTASPGSIPVHLRSSGGRTVSVGMRITLTAELRATIERMFGAQAIAEHALEPA